ncbi:MAG TPA: hypothetical protein VEK76_13110 [Candidatus Binatia bacterium]|nr:hypothetical protein [Candidatus Binatia bacterium]
MGRVIHVRVRGLHPGRRDAAQARFSELARRREWRDGHPWLADERSLDILSQLFFGDQRETSSREDPEASPLSAATFIRVLGDETDALAVLFIFRDLSERFGLRVELRDPDNPIAKLRRVELDAGRLPGGLPLEAVLVRRPIFKKLPDGRRLELFPPRALTSAFGMPEARPPEHRGWSFLVAGMRGEATDFFEAEAEAMRIQRGLDGLGKAG